MCFILDAIEDCIAGWLVGGKGEIVAYSNNRANQNTAFLALICAVLLSALVFCFIPLVPHAYAADDKPDSVILQIGSDKTEIDVAKNVATLNKNTPDVELAFTIKDAYTNLSSNIKRREFVLVDSSGKTVETIYSDTGNSGLFTIGKLKDDCKLMLVTTTRDANGTAWTKRYEQQLNVRLADTKPAENSISTGSTSGNAGISEDGGTWSFSNGLEYEFKNTGFKFLEGTKMNLGAIKLPLQYKHNPDGTTIVGINASPEDKFFYEAVKNGNVWQKYSSDKMAEMTKQMDKGWSGKKLGTWGGKFLDWTICGYMEFNTKDPAAPRAINLIISTGMKAEGHAQYLIFTGTITFTIGGKATLQGKLTPAKGLEGKFNLGAYAGLELYIGLGLNYVASVGGYGKGQINIDFQILPETLLENIKLSGELGAKAKLFGFTIYTWTILKGEKPLYTRDTGKKQTKAASAASMTAQSNSGNLLALESQEGLGVCAAEGETESANPDGSAASPINVSGDTPYPLDSRDYLDTDEAKNEAPLSAQADSSAAPSKGSSLFAQSEGTTAQDAQDAQDANTSALKAASAASTSSRANSGSSPASEPQEGPGASASEDKTESANPDGSAVSPKDASGDSSRPLDSRDNQDTDEAKNEALLSAQADSSAASSKGTSLFAQSEGLIAQDAQDANTILSDIYGEAEPACVTTNKGPVIVYVADADQVGGSRDAANRSVVVYTRYTDDGWTKPKVIDGLSSSDYARYADYSPSVTTDGKNCYVAWLAADSSIGKDATIGEVGGKLDIRMATIAPDDSITVETVCEESDNAGTMPASPKAVKVGNDLYTGWYTNQTSGSSGEVIGLSGNHTVFLHKRNGDGTWTKVSETAIRAGAITSFDVGKYGDTAACAWSFDSDFKSTAKKDAQGVDIAFPRNGQEEGANTVTELHSSSVYTLASGSGKSSLIAEKAGNAQFAKKGDADVLTYALETASDDAATPNLSIMSSSAPGAKAVRVLDGAKVDLPTPYYLITGDISGAHNGNISFLTLDNGTSDIQALVTTGKGDSDWSSVVEATVEEDIVTNYCATFYSNGLPLFIYLTEDAGSADGGLSAQADDGGADINQTTEESLKHLSVVDADYDEYGYKSGEEMPVIVYVENDGMLDINGVDIWVDDGTLRKVASNDVSLPLDTDDEDEESEDSSITFNYAIPSKESVGNKAHEFTVYAAPKGANVTENTIKHAKATESAMTLSLGAASLALEADQQIVDDQESIAATVTNDGIVPHAAKLVFLNADTGDVLDSVDVPELEEAQKFEYTYSAPNKYFQNDGVKSIIVTLENDGTEGDGYEINNTEFISTWDVIADNPTPAAQDTGTTPRTLPKTGDPLVIIVLMVRLGIGVVSVTAALRARKSS